MTGVDDVGKPVLQPVDVTSAVDQACAQLRRAIVRGDMAPGSSFALRTIAHQLGISFIPVREALRSLEAQGLIIIRPGRSAEVAPLNHADVRGIYRLRKLLEPEISGRVSELLTDAHVNRLEHLLEEYVDSRSDIERRWELHRQFHFELLRPAATTWDIRTLQMLWDAGERYVRHAFDRNATSPEEPERRAAAHLVLLRAVASRDPDLARAAALEHLVHNEAVAVLAVDYSPGVAPTGTARPM